ncbi:MAG TPA: hypothetical protein PKK06_03685 [Phycisphaerae bacterium]|nr:hypothetical protein [Phycisphaerae bacterium]HNU45380.1 hypothetical protein [Phycisphaerae bacterium]
MGVSLCGGGQQLFTYVLFESPCWLVAVWAGFELGALLFWARQATRRRARVVWMGLLVLPALLGLQMVVVTPREQVMSLCRQLARLVEEGNVRAIGAHLSSALDAEGMGRDELLAVMERTLTRYHVRQPRLFQFEVTFPEPGVGIARFGAACDAVSEEAYANRVQSRWQLELRRVGDKWEVTRIKVVETPLSPIRSLKQFR